MQLLATFVVTIFVVPDIVILPSAPVPEDIGIGGELVSAVGVVEIELAELALMCILPTPPEPPAAPQFVGMAPPAPPEVVMFEAPAT